MNNDMMIMINGQRLPVSRVKHWAFSPESFVPNRSESEMMQWNILKGVKDAWERLDPSVFMRVLSPGFSYGSYWVNSNNLDRDGYQKYIKEKFDTIRRTNATPKLDVVVLYEGLAPEQFYYALRMRQGNVETLLTFRFDEQGLASLYMTDPQIFTFEPTFVKGGIVKDNGEPRIFKHTCPSAREGTLMSAKQLQEFAVECVTKLYREAGAIVSGCFKSVYKEFPNIITKCGPDTFYHRVDVSMPDEQNRVSGEEIEEFLSAARANNAWAMVMPISLYCTETNGEQPLCGGSFFMKAMESRRIY